MANAFYHLLGQLVLAVHTCETQPEIREELSKAAMAKDQIDRARQLLEQAEALVARRLDEEEDRTTEHGLHAAVAEVEMWMQTTRFRLKKAGVDKALVEEALGHEIHEHDHSLTAVAQTRRLLSMIRTHEVLQKALGSERSTADVLLRGHTLIKKVYTYTNMRLSGSAAPTRMAAMAEVASLHEAMQEWVERLERTAQKLSAHPEWLGLLGSVPEGLGLPLGGGSFAVVLHEEARTTAPSADEAKKTTSGWSIGREGRNRENLGKGFTV